MSSPVGSEAQADAIAAARKFIAARQRPDWHTVAAVVLTAAGRRHIGINLDSVLPRASVCAEPVAFGMAVAEDADDRVVFCAAVNRRGEVIPPCGPCRELMMDFARDAIVGLPLAGGDPMA
ncbi:MAG: cytidine deaminase, partial [Pseudomonadota bacterium]